LYFLALLLGSSRCGKVIKSILIRLRISLILTYVFLRYSVKSTLTNVGIVAMFWKPLNHDVTL